MVQITSMPWLLDALALALCLLSVLQTKTWMSKHRREVAQQIKAEKEKQLEPVHRRTIARQKAAQEEVVQASQLHHTNFLPDHGISSEACTLHFVTVHKPKATVRLPLSGLHIAIHNAALHPGKDNQTLLAVDYVNLSKQQSQSQMANLQAAGSFAKLMQAADTSLHMQWPHMHEHICASAAFGLAR